MPAIHPYVHETTATELKAAAIFLTRINKHGKTINPSQIVRVALTQFLREFNKTKWEKFEEYQEFDLLVNVYDEGAIMEAQRYAEGRPLTPEEINENRQIEARLARARTERDQADAEEI